MAYHGQVYDDGRIFLIIEGDHDGYAPVVTIKAETTAFQSEFYLDPEQAIELARHLNEAAATATADKGR